MKKNVLITGANGMLASQVSKVLEMNDYQIRLLSRNSKPNFKNVYKWDIETGYIDEKALENVNIIVHLAGASVGEKRWTNSVKKEIKDSRVKGANLLFQKVFEKNIKLDAYISASGISYYGSNTGDTWVDEQFAKGDGFLADVVALWENAAEQFKLLADRVVKLRFGVILSSKSGLVKKMLPIFKVGLGAPLGSGKQYISWVHESDAVNAIIHSIESFQVEGVYNIVSENPVTNREFSKTLAKCINRPFLGINVPSLLIKGVLGEMSEIVLGGNRVCNKKSLDAGFYYLNNDLESTLYNLISS